MEFLMDPSIWAGLLTLVVLEIVLGIDNLVFIAILAEKLPPEQRNTARVVGLMLALLISTAFTDFFRMTLWFGIPFTLLLTGLYFYSRRSRPILSTIHPPEADRAP